jgi:small-conductance mechanosensitive channel
MVDLSAMIGAAVLDPLIIVLCLFVVGVATSHLLFRRYPLGRAIVRVVFLIFLTFALLHAGIVPYQSSGSTGTPFRDVVHAILKIAWWLWAAWFLIGFLRVFIVVEHRPREGRLLQDLIAGLIYLAAVFAIIAYVLNLPIQGLLATSGAIAIILGLALQSTLGDVFSGIVLNFSHPYRPGDWISIDGQTGGRVVETNWRATHILTAQRDLCIIPNSTIAKSRIVNASSPSGIHGATIKIQVGGRTTPSLAADILERAILNCAPILEEPSPSITTKVLNAAYTEFEIDFFVKDLSSTTRAQNELLDLIYRHLSAADIDLALPADSPYRPADGQTSAVPRTRTEMLLKQIAIFADLSAAERTAIAAKLKGLSYDEGENLVEPGVVPQSLYIIASGVLSYSRNDGEIDEELLRLGPGDHFGEISLLTGTLPAVRITALTPVIVYELTKASLEQVLASHPEVSKALNRTLIRRQAAVSPSSAPEPENVVQPHRLRSWVSDWLHRRYEIATSK